ncbi:MAG: DNA repair protein RadC [Lentisphaeria bacterium]|nr:DNA repair protein RadC [Lentisphaeria bacterium]
MATELERKNHKRNKNTIAEPAAPDRIYQEEMDLDNEKTSFVAGKFSAKGKKNVYTGENPAFGKKAAQDFAAGKIDLLPGSDNGGEKKIASRKVKQVAEKEKQSHYTGHRERLRTRYLLAGAEGMTDYDLLELLLTYSIPRRDVKVLARTLLEKFQSLANIMDAEIGELCAVPGISRNSAILCRIHKDLCCRYLKEGMMRENVLNSIASVEKYARMKLGGYKDEMMMAIYLNVHNYVIDSCIVSKGTVDRATVYPRNIAEEALLKKAASVILVHNHPGGEVMPSEEDVYFTRMVRNTLLPLEITLLDHLIVCRDFVFSFHNSLNEVLTATEEEFRKGV